MKAYVDQVKCRSVGTCVQLCPSVFRFEPGSKKAIVQVREIPEGEVRRCVQAAERCPERAITILPTQKT